MNNISGINGHILVKIINENSGYYVSSNNEYSSMFDGALVFFSKHEEIGFSSEESNYAFVKYSNLVGIQTKDLEIPTKRKRFLGIF